MNDTDETNIAATLHNIAANCDNTSGKILKKCQKAANKGKLFIVVKASYEDNKAAAGGTLTPLVEKLRSLGFVVAAAKHLGWNGKLASFLYGYGDDTYDHIKVSW